MTPNMERVSEAFKAIRKIQQIVETFEAGEFTIPGTDLTYEFTAQQVTDLKAEFVAQRAVCVNALNSITANGE